MNHRMLYGGINEAVLRQVPASVTRLLDLGCGVGSMAKLLKARTGCQVMAITVSTEEARLAAESLDQVLVADLDQFDFASLGMFDCILCSHVLEHLREPGRVLSELRPHLAPNGVLVAALPNVLFWKQRGEFLRGRFRYAEGGLMDRTHCRFFDWHTARELITGAGYALETAQAAGGFPLSRLLGKAGCRLDALAVRAFPGLFGFQFLLVARVRSAASQVQP